MELDEMRGLWNDMSEELVKEKIVTDKIIIEMTQQKITSKLNAITIPEMIGTLICFSGGLYLSYNFHYLDTWYLQISGVFTILFCFIMPIMSLKSIYNMKKINLTNETYKNVLEQYATSKKQFIKVQKVSYYLSFIFMITLLLIVSKIENGSNMLLENTKFFMFMPIGFIIFHFFAKWIFKKYKRIADSAEIILKELN